MESTEQPDHSESPHGRCANCGAPLTGPYCAQCGQRARSRIAPLRTLLTDFLGEVFNLDARFFRTLVPLLFKPGTLTNEYIAGRRARYVPPLRLFVFSSFVLFLLLGVISSWSIESQQPVSARIDSLAATAQDSAEAAALQATLDSSQTELNRAGYDVSDTTAAIRPLNQSDPVQLSTSITGMLQQVADSLTRKNTIRAQFQHALIRGVLRADRNPKQFVQNAIGRASGVAFLLLPIFALLLKGLYLRSGRLYAEHLIFALHIHAFLFIVLLLVTLLNLTGVGFLVSAAPFLGTIGPAAYLLVALRRVYAQGWIKTTLKFCTLTLIYLLIFTIAASGLLVLTFVLM